MSLLLWSTRQSSVTMIDNFVNFKKAYPFKRLRFLDRSRNQVIIINDGKGSSTGRVSSFACPLASFKEETMIFVSSFCTSDTQSSHLRGSVEQASLDTFAVYLHREQKFSTRIPIFRSAKQWRYQSSRSSAIELEGRSKKEERKGKERKEVEESGVAS